MSVSALTNSFYNYVPVTSSQYETSSTNSASNSQAQENVKAVDEKSTQIQATPNTYNENSENTSSNNSNNSENSGSYMTGEEILASMPEKKSQSSDTQQLSEAEQKQIEELKARDREVKAHEQAHIAAGGSYVKGGATYDYQTGPDGKQYAVGGSVNIDTSPVADDPEATIAKAQVVIKAALAPAEPSGQDQKVASAARQMMSEARKELTSQKNAEINTDTESSAASNTDETAENSAVKETSSSDTQKTAENNAAQTISPLETASSDNKSSKEMKNNAENNAVNGNTTAQNNNQNIRESNITSLQQKNNQNTAAANYNIGALISLTA